MDYGVLMEDYDQSMKMVMMMMMPESFVGAQVPNYISTESSTSLEMLVEKQRQEIDLFVQQQSNHLRRSIHQQSKNHLASTLRAMESKAASIIREKDEELAAARSRALQLEACANKLQQERDAWEKLATERGALAISLDNALRRLQSPCLSSTGSSEGEDRDGGCGGAGSRSSCCRICGVHDSCMLLLPCRHVCSCEACEPSLESCPVCSWRKEAGVEVFFA